MLQIIKGRFYLPLIILILVALSLALFIRYKWVSSRYPSPLDIPIQLAANFGELREDHFHMGLDIRTNGREGLPVHSVADGYISHISIRENGLGKAIYITDPNGLVTVFAHLSLFTEDLEKFVHTRQYATQSWEQDLDLPAGRYPVLREQLIAYSGNTGNSAAPHLHFEIRDSKTGRNLNPLLSGLHIPDNIPPVITGLYWYDRRYSTYSTRAKKIALAGRDGHCHTIEQIVRVSSPVISLGISVTDKSANSPHLSGIYHAELWLDNTLIYAFSLRDIPDSDTRYVNACIDYTKWVRSGIYVQHLSILPGNHLPIFTISGKDGTIQLGDARVHNLHIVVEDIYQNRSVLDLQMQYDSASETQAPDLPSNNQQLQPGRENSIKGHYVRAYFDAAAFYDRAPFLLKEQGVSKVAQLTRKAGGDNNAIQASPLIQLGDPSIPVHDRFRVQLRTTLALDNPLRKKTIMQLVSGPCKMFVKGSWQGDWMSGYFIRLGAFQLIIDTTPPMIESLGWEDGQIFPPDALTINLQCKDDLGSVPYFRAEMDGQWVPFARKADHFMYLFDDHCAAGRHTLTVEVKDVAGNVTKRSFSFTRVDKS